LIPNPIRKVLSTMAARQVRALLMGGQACVFYGAAEFSRDVDLAVLAEAENLALLERALADLKAEIVFVPPLALEYLQRGHAIHFRCHHPEAMNLRVDVMAKMRGVAPFSELWQRRTTVEDRRGGVYELLALSDLVHAKKTQREKDWPMIRRLLEADYAAAGEAAVEPRLGFWLRELRTPELLIDAAARRPDLCARLKAQRPLLDLALAGEPQALAAALEAEEKQERERDRIYWQPLKAELQKLRHARLQNPPG